MSMNHLKGRDLAARGVHGLRCGFSALEKDVGGHLAPEPGGTPFLTAAHSLGFGERAA